MSERNEEQPDLAVELEEAKAQLQEAARLNRELSEKYESSQKDREASIQRELSQREAVKNQIQQQAERPNVEGLYRRDFTTRQVRAFVNRYGMEAYKMLPFKPDY